MPDVICVVWAILAALLGLGAGGGIAYTVIRRHDRQTLSGAQHRAQELLDNARKEADNLFKAAELKAKDDLFRQKDEFNKEV